ncbi:MAG: twin-arginine translocase TatA/TatE family subunit [Sphingorhabdus sp.]|jgi:sec-independent protein translocase protein TatA|nr:twin-arginine translocase TatA/TatE family subunit [Sphingorhabdus sp.]
MQPSIWQIVIIGALVLILFGRGRISEMMGDVGKGIKSFKQGISEEEKSSENPQRIDSKPTDINAETTTRSDKTAG